MEDFKERNCPLGCAMRNHIKNTIINGKTDFIIPILDGHSGSDTDFTTIENNADEIINYIDENFCGSIFMICGLSLGGQILTEILAKRKDICRYAIIESALVLLII